MPDAKDTDYKRYRGSGGWGRRKRFSSVVACDTMLAHSSLEYDYLRDCELDGSNRWFLEQPFKIKYRAGAGTRFYTPDALVVRTGHVECVEVKFEHQAGKREAEAKWHAVAECLLGMELASGCLRNGTSVANRGSRTSRRYSCIGTRASTLHAWH